MAGVNKVIIVGRLGSDPELKTINSGENLCRFSVATSENWNDKEGQKQEKTEWHRIVVWRKLAEVCGKYLSKGRQVYLEGRLQTNSWEDTQGQKRYSTEIVATTVQFLGGREEASSSQQMGGGSGGAPSPQDFGPEPSFDSNEELPF